MEFKDNKEVILIIIGIILSLTGYGIIIGLPLIIIGIYSLNKKSKNPLEEESEILENEINKKRKELYNLNQRLQQEEQEKTNELNKKILEKQYEFESLKQKLQQEEQEKIKELNEKITEKQYQLDHIEEILNKKEADKQQELDALEQKRIEEINKRINKKQYQLDHIEEILDKKEADKQQELDTLDQRLQEEENKKRNEMDIRLQDKINTIKENDKKIQKQKTQLKELDHNRNLTLSIEDKQRKLNEINQAIQSTKKEYDLLEDDISMYDYGLYTPTYTFTTSEKYKDKLKEVRNKQKQLIKNKEAAVCYTRWHVNNDYRKGQAMTNQNIKQAIYAFNIECMQIINNTKASNFDRQKNKITKSFNKINKMNERNDVHLTDTYLYLKYDELQLALEYDLKKQEEKEKLREAREREREEKKIQKELDKRQREIEKQKTKLQKELEDKKKQAEKEAKDEKEKQKLLNRIRELEQQLAKQEDDLKNVENKRLRTGAGFVYIISNIGSFGEGVYKIGVTRRDDPVVRVNELSSASVPFRYDVNAFIFSEDAFKLETSLHQKYKDCRVNKVNNRKEFFRLTEEDINNIISSHKDNTYSFTLQPEASEYHETLALEKKQQSLKI